MEYEAIWDQNVYRKLNDMVAANDPIFLPEIYFFNFLPQFT